LLIFDNALKPEDIRDYLPRGSTGHVLITSRHQAWEKLSSSLSIDIWSREESVDFLIRRTKDKNRLSAESVAEELGDLPLALEQAAAFINETAIGFNDYLKLYRDRRNELWKEENPPLNYPDTVGTTWSLAIEKVQEEAPVGVLVLNLCSYLAPDEMPRSLLGEASEYLPEQLSALFNDSLALHKGVRVLNHYSLVNAQPESLSVHRLVQAVVQDRLKTEEQKLWAKVAVRTVNAVFPYEGYQHPNLWPKCAALLSHGRVVIEHVVEHEAGLEEAADLMISIGSYMYGRASYNEAEKLARRSLDIREALLGKDHSVVGSSTSWLGFILQAQGRYSEAEPFIRRALEIRKTQFGADHPQVAANMSNLAISLKAQGKYSEAEPLFRRALGIDETQLGADRPQVAIDLNNLAELLRAQGKYSDAEPLFRRALEIHETQLGADHPYVASDLNNLAGLLQDQGKYSEAEPLYRQALEIYETQMGVDHPHVATILNNLAELLRAQGKYSEAEPLCRRALEIRETKLEAGHPSVATSLNNLALLLQAQVKYSEAEPLYRRALEITETQLGINHRTTATVRENLELLLSDMESKGGQ
jgi:tetratricopeptide (TPR) repeat protein